MKQFMTGIVAAMAMGVMAETANTVKVTKFHQSYPYSGKATVEYTVGGALSANAFAEITLNTDDASATFVQSNIVTGANTFTIDFASSFGGTLLLTNASFVVTISGVKLGGVQLWENGRTGRSATWVLQNPKSAATTSGGAIRWGIQTREAVGSRSRTEQAFYSALLVRPARHAAKTIRRFYRLAISTQQEISWLRMTRLLRISAHRGACRQMQSYPPSSTIAPSWGSPPTAYPEYWLRARAAM